MIEIQANFTYITGCTSTYSNKKLHMPRYFIFVWFHMTVEEHTTPTLCEATCTLEEIVITHRRKPISSVPLISRFFTIVKTLVTYWISCSYLTGVNNPCWQAGRDLMRERTRSRIQYGGWQMRRVNMVLFLTFYQCLQILSVRCDNVDETEHGATVSYQNNDSGVGVTKAPFVNFSVSKIFDLAKVPVRLFAWHSYLTGVTTAELRRHLSNMNMIFNR